MPRYHFHINGETNDEGCELDDVNVAQCEALAMAGKIICDEDSETFWNGGDWTMKVTTPEGLTLFDLVVLGTEAPAIRERTNRAAKGLVRSSVLY